MNPLIQLKTTPSLLITLVLLCFGLSPTAKALLPAPSPDGGYPGGNTAEGVNALHDVNTAVGINNTAVGANALTHDTTGYSNVAIGEAALANNTTGNFNMAIGTEALRDNNASFNLAIGFRVLFMNTTGRHLTGIGAAALRNNTTGSFNTAIGADALRESTTGEDNTAIGADALSSNTEGFGNSATGAQALQDNISGNSNTAAGDQALLSNTVGNENTAVGLNTLRANTMGDNNVAVGSYALSENTTGSFNIALGRVAGINVNTANNVICIGLAGADVSDSCFIGNIRSTTTQHNNAIPVVVDTSGQLGTVSSSRRFKKQIKPMDNASEAILALKPVTFSYKSDSANRLEFGLIAEDVAQVHPDLVVRNEKGEIYTVRYDAVNAMLLNEFLKARRQIDAQQKQIKALAAGLQRVSAQLAAASPSRGGLEASRPAPQTVNNP